MVNAWHMLLADLKREKLLSISNLAIMTLTFLMLGVFVVVIVLSQTALRYLEQQAQLTLFFKDDYTEQNITTLKAQLEKNPKISEVTYVSKEAALKIFRDLNKDEPVVLENTTASILPASLNIKTKDLADLAKLGEQYKTVDGVESVRYFENVIQKFRLWSNVVYIVGGVLVLIFLIISYSVIVSTLRTTITSKGTELEIMKLVGATDAYVKAPLIYQGVFYGAVSSTIAATVILLLGVWLAKWGLFAKGLAFGFLPGLYVNPIVGAVVFAFVLILSGFGLGYFGSSSAIKKYLKY